MTKEQIVAASPRELSALVQESIDSYTNHSTPQPFSGHPRMDEYIFCGVSLNTKECIEAIRKLEMAYYELVEATSGGANGDKIP